MLGVISKFENEIVAEVFQLFKTPWEYYRPDVDYRVVLTTEDRPVWPEVDLLIISTSQRTTWDISHNVQCDPCLADNSLKIDGQEISLNGPTAQFTGEFRPLGTTSRGNRTVIFEARARRGGVIRIGYNLFSEIRHLLVDGQPSRKSHLPTADVQIDILRQSMIRWAIPFVEIPPFAPARAFFVCLSHDVDFHRLRDHRFDHTLLGFIYRAGLGTLLKALRGAGTANKVMRNWWALFKLPLVLAGLTRDPWPSFKQYALLEKSLGATYFLIPFKHRPGRGLNGGHAPSQRATRYDVADIVASIQYLEQSGFEIGLHGIDAWSDPAACREETNRLTEYTTSPIKGVRMHWLYFNARSPKALEEAGLTYDSSVGYNDSVGFKGGTAQVYRPPGTQHLLELPMILQDTALFYPDRMNLSELEASEHVMDLIEKVSRYGGCLTVNWHHRSIAPERLWGEFYVELLQLLKQKRGVFLTARDAVAWFDARRQAVFKMVQFSPDRLHVEIDVSNQAFADMTLRVYHPVLQTAKAAPLKFREFVFNNHLELSIAVDCLTGNLDDGC